MICGFHLQTMTGVASGPIQVLESSEDELSGVGDEGETKSDKKNCVQREKRIITRAEILEDPETYCHMYLRFNDHDGVSPAPTETPHVSAESPGQRYDWTNTAWSKGGLQFVNTNQIEINEKQLTASAMQSYSTNSFIGQKQPDYSNKDMKAPNYSNENVTLSKNRIDTIPSSIKSLSKERKDKNAGMSKGLKENIFQKRLNKALEQPITITKATSMMERMGWKGGPLGKHSDGILEPIAPDATYIRKIGFGLVDRPENNRKRETKKPETQPKKKAKLSSGKPNNVHKKGKSPKGMAKDKKDIVTTNSLIEILQFVRNNREIEVSFDKKLTGMERKVIHNTVQFIIHDTQELETIDWDNQYHVKLLELIYDSNHFNLVTESEGEKKQRQLTLYKEAKECTYLVTPDDLIPQDSDDNMTDDVIEIDDTNVYKDTASQDNVIPGNKRKEPDKNIQKESKNIQSESKSLQNEPKSIQNEPKSKQNEPISIQNEPKSKRNEPKSIQSEHKSIQNEPKCRKAESTSKQINAKTIEDSNPFLKSIKSIHTTLPNKKTYKGIVKTSAINCLDKSMKLDRDVNINRNITEILKEYFMEFLNDKVYTEFRFLGPFTIKQIDEINLFVNNLHSCVYNGESEQCFGEILDRINDEEEFYFEVKEDCNGSVVVYKCKTEDGIE